MKNCITKNISKKILIIFWKLKNVFLPLQPQNKRKITLNKI